MEGLTFWEACKRLAERYGIPLPKRTEAADAETRARASVFEAQEIALRVFRAALAGPTGGEARDYVARRGLTPALVEEFGLGFAERGGQTLVRQLERSGISPDMMESTGLVVRRQDGTGFLDRFRNRLTFPIHNETGKLIGFAGRALEAGAEPKYLNSPETSIYRKSHVLYNLHRARRTIRRGEPVILVEGYMDVIGLWGAGIGAAVASCGTAFAPTQARMLKRHSENVVVNFDPDTAGVNAAERSIQVLLDEDLRVRVLELEGGLDPDEYVGTHGADRYRTVLEKAPRYFYWLADRARSRFDFRDAEGRLAGLRFLLPSIQRIPDKLERAAIAGDIASYLGVEASLVLENFRKSAADRSEGQRPPPREDLPASELLLLRSLVNSETVRRELEPRIRALTIADPGVASRLRSQPLLKAILEAGDPPDWEAALSRLAPAEADLLSRLLLADEDFVGEPDPAGLPQALACLECLESTSAEIRVAEIKLRIREAERSGRLRDALTLMEELSQMESRANRVAGGSL
jgi:DNA primase